MTYYRTPSTPFATSHVQEYDYQDYKPQPTWIRRSPEENHLYDQVKGHKVSQTLPPTLETKTLEFLPHKDEPSMMWSGYKLKPRNPRYETTSQATYGRYLPTIHEMPDVYHPLTQTFSTSMLSSHRSQARSVTYRDIIKWASICTLIFGFTLLIFNVFSYAFYPEFKHIWTSGMVMGILLMTTGILGVLTTMDTFAFGKSQHPLAVSFLALGSTTTFYSAGIVVGSAIFFPEVLDDRIDHLQVLKSTMMIAYIFGFMFAMAETLMSLRCVYAQFFNDLSNSNLIEISPLVSCPSRPCLNLEDEEEMKPMTRKVRKGPPDVRMYLSRLDEESEEEENDEPKPLLVDTLA
ncbi:hypothetical protein RvY_13559 [Ramazzottius varieornatus]|uniref:Uncharacterized protein n=1 Tax=Ramazzottius varieornatus TaxID=947166 RepID=A0A1D1VNA5_RAMVA|nr:hypothetical protein RvY_13559 [Ramazzottius varieornatus]